MKLSKEAIEKFKEIYRKKFGEEISNENTNEFEDYLQAYSRRKRRKFCLDVRMSDWGYRIHRK